MPVLRGKVDRHQRSDFGRAAEARDGADERHSLGYATTGYWTPSEPKGVKVRERVPIDLPDGLFDYG